MRTLCLDARMIHSGGIGTYIKNLLPFIEKAFDLYLLGNERDLAPFIRSSKVISCSSKIYSVGEQIELPRKIPSCDLYWSPHYNSPLLPIRAKKRVVTIHDVNHLAFAATYSLKERVYAKYVIARAIQSAEKVITISNFSAKELMRYANAPQNKLEVIYFGMNQELFSGAMERMREERYFLFVGNLKPHKNIKRLLQAFHQFFLEKREGKLLLIGRRSGLIHQESIETILESLPEIQSQVEILENISDKELPHYYAGAEALTFFSLYEGFGFPPLEAMSCGCPVIASDIEVLREIYGDSASFADPLNVQDMAQKMHFAWGHKDPQKKQKAKQLAETFLWETCAKKHLNVFNEIC